MIVILSRCPHFPADRRWKWEPEIPPVILTSPAPPSLFALNHRDPRYRVGRRDCGA